MKTTIPDGKTVISLGDFDRTPNLAELKMSYRRRRSRRPKPVDDTRHAIVDSKSCEAYLRQIWNQDTLELREEFVMVCLNGAHHAMGWVNISSGGLDSALADSRIIFGVALQTASAAIVVAHNHPSGSLKPSPHDLATTKRLRSAGEILSITLLDHLIITRDAYFSFADSGWPE
jgi:DNA repair protein RadC